MTETRKLIDRIILDECEYCSGLHCLNSGCLYWDILKKLRALEFIESLPSVNKKKPTKYDDCGNITATDRCCLCNKVIYREYTHCPYCGQAIDWNVESNT